MKTPMLLVGLTACLAFVAVASADHNVPNERENLVPMSTSDKVGPEYQIDFGLIPSSTSGVRNRDNKPNNDNVDNYNRHKNNEAVEREAPSHIHGHSDSSDTDGSDDDDKPTSTVHVRRIYIVPSMGPSSWFSNPFALSPIDSSLSNERRLFPGRNTPSLWSLLGDTSPMGDTDNGDVESAERKEATDEENTASSETKPTTSNDASRPSPMSPDSMMTDMLMDMIQQSLRTRLTTLKNYFEDMQPAASGDGKNSTTGVSDSASGTSQLKPGTHNETKEEIVDIGGVKYLRKTMITKNVGQNHMFFTKRFLLTPLNETASSDNSTTPAPTSSAVPTTVNGSESNAANTPRSISAIEDRPSTSGSSMTSATSNTDVKVDIPAPTTNNSDSGNAPTSWSVVAGNASTRASSSNNGAPPNREQLEKEDASTVAPVSDGDRNSERLVRKKRAS